MTEACSQKGCGEPASRTMPIYINQMGRLHHTLEVPLCERHWLEMRPDDERPKEAAS